MVKSSAGPDMQAIVVNAFGGPDVLVEQCVPMPKPHAGEVRVRLCAAGVNPVETYLRAGQYAQLPELPYVPGNDGAGIVDACGANLPSGAPHVGERVFVAAARARRCTGTYAEFVVCDASAVAPLPDAVPFEQGAGLGTPGLAAADALFVRARVRPGETVLVHGASGGVGTLAVQLAHRIGAVVHGTAGDVRGRQLVERLGARRVFDHHAEGYLDEILAATQGRGVDVVIDMAAQANLMKDAKVAAVRGRIVIVGSRGSLDFDPRALMKADLDERDDAVKVRASLAGVTFLCIRGNHDRNPAALSGYRLQPWHGGEAYVDEAYPRILFARDGSVFDLEGRPAITIGGAYSVDKRHRLANGHLWFPDEQLTEAEKRHVEQVLDRRRWRIDTVLSHTCPAAFVPQEALLPSIDQSTVDTSMEDWLQRIERRLDYRRWYCGHFHIEKQVGRLRFLHKDIVPL